MFNLFETKQLFQIVSDPSDILKCGIELATFGHVNKLSDSLDCYTQRKTTFESEFNLVLYCSDYRLLLFQYGLFPESEEQEEKTLSKSRELPRWRHFTIPIDSQKGPIVSMCLDRSGTCFLAITSHSIIYYIPFRFQSYYDRILRCQRTVIEEDANLIRSCSLKQPTSLQWWQRDSRYVVERSSIALVGSESGQIAMIDLDLDQEFRRLSVPFGIKSLALYDEMYNRSLLITCHQGYQYQLILEEFRNSSTSSPSQQKKSSMTSRSYKSSECSQFSPNDDSSISGSLTNFNNYYLSCLLNLPFENEQDILGKVSSSSSGDNFEVLHESNNFWRPQLITFNNEIDTLNNLLKSENNQTSPDAIKDSDTIATVAAEFFFFTDHDVDLQNNSHFSTTSITTPKIAIYPQTHLMESKASSNKIYVVKYRNSKFKLKQTLSSPSSSSSSLSTASMSSGHDPDSDSLDSDDSNDFLLIGDTKAKSLNESSTTLKSRYENFCNISICHDQIMLEVYEYPCQKFCTKTILLSSARLFLISLNPKLCSKNSEHSNLSGTTRHQQQQSDKMNLIRLIDCSYRFLLLVFQDRCYLVSKAFAEHNNKSTSSPRSPLLLKRSDSIGYRRPASEASKKIRGSFRRKNPTESSNGPAMSVIDEFRFDEKDDFKDSNESSTENEKMNQIVDVFLLNPGGCKCLGIRDYLHQKLSHYFSSTNENESSYLDHSCLEKQLVEILSSPEVDQYTIQIDEQFLIVTKRSVYLIESRQKSFGLFFHSEIESYVVRMDQPFEPGHYHDGEIITRTKLLVDCFTAMGTPGRSQMNLSTGFSSDSPQLQPDTSLITTIIPNQSWQLWLCRSALILMRSISEHSELLCLPEFERIRILSLGDYQKSNISDHDKLIHWIDNRMHQVFRLLELSRCSRRRVITSFNLFRFWSRSISQLHKFFHTKILFELNDEERQYLSLQLFDTLLSIYNYYHYHSMKFENQINYKEFECHQKESERNLYNYLYEYRQYYDSQRILKKLIDLNLYVMAEYLALLTGDYLHLIHFILNKFPEHELVVESETTSEIQHKLLDILTSRRVTYALILSSDYILDGECRSISLIEKYLQFLFAYLPRLNLRFLHRLACIFDPVRLPTRLLLNQTLFYCNQTYLCDNDNQNDHKQDSFDSETLQTFQDQMSSDTEVSLITTSGRLRKTLLPVKRCDLLNLHIFIQLLYFRKLAKHSKVTLYDWSFMKTVTRFIPDHLKSYNQMISDHYRYIRPSTSEHSSKLKNNTKNLFGASTANERTYFDWNLAAGTYCSLVHNRDYFCLWGKFDYSYSNSEKFARSFLISSNTSSPIRDNPKTFKMTTSSFTHQLKTPTLNRFFSSVINAPIKSISIGHHHMMILTDCGLYGLGSSAFGQLGLGSQVLSSRYPTLLYFGSSGRINVWKVICGSYHTLALADKGHLYSFGWALHGQLGHGLIEDEYEPRLVRYFTDTVKVSIADVAAGYAHTAALTSTGDLYVFGENSYGQLGLKLAENPSNSKVDKSNGKSKFSLPQKFRLLQGPIRLVSCGLFHTVVISTERSSESFSDESNENIEEKLYCWGIDPKTWRLKMRSDRVSNRQNQHFQRLDSSMSFSCSSPVYDYSKIREISLSRLPKGSHISKIASGQSHSLLLTDQGQIFAFGYGREGQLGIRTSSNHQASEFEAIPIIDEQQQCIRYIDIACGSTHSLALDFQGNVWGWGQTSNGQLGTSGSETSDADDSTNNSENHLSGTLSNQLHQRLTRLGGIKSAQIISNNHSSLSVNQTMLSSPKNNRWLPLIIISLYEQVQKMNRQTSSEKNIPVDDFTSFEIPKTQQHNRSELLLQKILLTILYNRHDLNFKSLIRRFEQLEFHQLSSIISWISEDYPQSLLFQFEALHQELCTIDNNDCKSILLSEISILLSFYMSTVSSKFSQSVQSELTLKITKNFVIFWKKLLEKQDSKFNDYALKPEDFIHILENVYFNDSNDTSKTINPYFGLQLLCLIKNMEPGDITLSLRHQLGLSDQILIRLVERTDELIKRCKQDPIVIIQELLNRTLDVNHIFQCPNIHINPDLEQNSSLRSFPLEMKWQKLVSEFQNLYQSKPNSTSKEHECDNESIDCIELQIPSDIENEDSSEPILLIFKCGHYMSQKKFFQTLKKLLNNKESELNSAKSSKGMMKSDESTYQKIFALILSNTESSADSTWLVDQIKDLDCLQCCLSTSKS